MAIVKIRPKEMAAVKAAGERLARRTHSRFVVNEARIEVAEESEESGRSEDDREVEKPLDLR